MSTSQTAPAITTGHGTLPLAQIHASPTNPRKTFDEEKMTQLAGTIRVQGILQPLLVRPWPGKAGVVECVDGHRRRLAAEKVGLAEVPVIVRELTDADVIAIQLISGETSEPLTPLEEAQGFKTALDVKDGAGQTVYTLRTLAEKLGCAFGHIAQRMSLLRLPANVRDWVASGSLSPKTATLLARIPDPAAMELAIKDVVFPKHREDPLPYKEAEAVIHERYMVSLKGAPFDVADATFDGPMRDEATKKPLPLACSGCPLKSGNNPEKFGDVKDKNTCTNPGCYRAKCNAAWDRAAAKAKAAGQRVLTDEETAEVFEKNSPTVQIAFSSPYVDVDSKPAYRHVANEVEDKNLPTWREMLATAEQKKKIKVPTVLARDRNGKQWELVQLTLAVEAARAIGEDYFKKVPVSEAMGSGARFERDAVRTTVRGTDDFAERKKDEAAATKKRLVENCLALVKLHDALSLKILGFEPITDALLPTALHHAGNDGQALFVKAFGLQSGGGDFNSDVIKAWFRKKSKSDRHAAIPLLLVAPSMKWNGLKCEGFVALAQSVKLDIAAIEKAAAAQLTTKAKPAAAGKPVKGAKEKPAAHSTGSGQAAPAPASAAVPQKFVVGDTITWQSGGAAKQGVIVTPAEYELKTGLKWDREPDAKVLPVRITKTHERHDLPYNGIYVEGMKLVAAAPAATVRAPDGVAAAAISLSEGKYVAVKTLLIAGKPHDSIAAQLKITVGQVELVARREVVAVKLGAKKRDAGKAAEGAVRGSLKKTPGKAGKKGAKKK